MINDEDAQDRLIDVLLREELGGEAPPNLAPRILKAAAEKPRIETALGVRVWKARERFTRLKIGIAVAATLALAVLCGLIISHKSSPPAAQTPPDNTVQPRTVATLTGAIQRGAVLTTSTDARTFELGGYCQLKMLPRTELKIQGQEKAEEIRLIRGTVQCEVNKAVGTFVVQSDMGTVSVTGTKFSVRVPESKGGAQMSVKQMFVRVTVGAVLLSGAWGNLALAANDEGGTVVGTVASKSETWLSVKAEGGDEPTLYMPYWRGGVPKDGGGFDKDMLGVIKGVATGSKVKIVWKLEEHPRIVSLEVLSAPEKKVEIASAEREHGGAEDVQRKLAEAQRKHKEAQDKPEKMREGDREKPREVERKEGDREKMREGDRKEAHREEKTGTLVGKVVSRLENAFEVKAENGDSEKFVARWTGGLPADGGGPDKEIVKQIQKLKVGEWVKVEWTQDERKRAVRIHTKRD